MVARARYSSSDETADPVFDRAEEFGELFGGKEISLNEEDSDELLVLERELAFAAESAFSTGKV